MSGTEGRVYGGNPNLIHVKDGEREEAGKFMAVVLDNYMREMAYEQGLKTFEEANEQSLCPGCYMIVALNMLIALAERNGQDQKEMALTMAKAFSDLAKGGLASREEITVMLDNAGCQVYNSPVEDECHD